MDENIKIEDEKLYDILGSLLLSGILSFIICTVTLIVFYPGSIFHSRWESSTLVPLYFKIILVVLFLILSYGGFYIFHKYIIVSNIPKVEEVNNEVSQSIS